MKALHHQANSSSRIVDNLSEDFLPRPISWLPRLHEISRSVSNSVRSHYDRRDLETLFVLQPRAAQKLLELLSSVQIGTSKLVDREMLSTFLKRVREAEDVTALLEQIRGERRTISKRNPRSLVRRDLEQVDLASLPDSIKITRGQLIVSFRSVEQLAENMLMLARVLENDGDKFASAFEPEPPPLDRPDDDELQEIAALLKG